MPMRFWSAYGQNLSLDLDLNDSHYTYVLVIDRRRDVGEAENANETTTAPPTPDSSGRDLDRRAAVRRVVTAVGLTAGALAIPTLVGTANAKPGDSLKAGGGTNAGDAQTSLRADSTIATLKVENTNVRSGPASNKVDIVAPQLRLSSPVPSATRPPVPDLASMKPGDIAAAGGLLYYGADIGAPTAVPCQIHTSTFANYFQPISTARSTLLATPKLTTAERKTLGPTRFDAAGRLRAGKRLGLDLRAWVDTSHLPTTAAVSVTITASDADTSGAVRAHGGEKNAGDINVCSYTVLPGAVLANGQALAIPATSGAILALDAADKLWISVSAATHLTIQIVALVIPDPSAMVESKPADDLPAVRRRGVLQRQAIREMTAAINPPK